MILDTINKSLELILGSAVTTTAMPITVDYVDMTTTTTLSGSVDSQSNGTSTVTILAAPAASTQRKVNNITVYNADSATKIVTIRLNNNTVLRPLVVISLASGDTLSYLDTVGYKVTDNLGNIHTVVTNPQLSIAAGKTVTINNSVTLAGTDAATYTFPSTTDTLARQNGDAAQVFSGAAATAAAHFVRSDQLSSNNIDFPKYTKLTSYTPTVTAQVPGATPPTFTVNTAASIVVGGLRFTFLDITVTAAGTGAGYIGVTTPTALGGVSCAGKELGVSAKVNVIQLATANLFAITMGDGGAAIITGYRHQITHISGA